MACLAHIRRKFVDLHRTQGSAKTPLAQAIRYALARLPRLEDTGRNTLRYVYDFGDGREHTLTVRQSLHPKWGHIYPRLTRFIGTCTPEDVGGVAGYQDFLQAIADPNHPEYESYTNWYDEHFDPENPPVDALTHNVTKLAKRWKPKKK